MQLGLFNDQVVHFLVAHRFGKTGGDFFESFQQVASFAEAVHDVFDHVFGGVQFRFLFKIADPDTIGRPGFAVKFPVDAGHDFQQGGFAGAVNAQHADFGTGQKGKRDAFKQFSASRKNLA